MADNLSPLPSIAVIANIKRSACFNTSFNRLFKLILLYLFLLALFHSLINKDSNYNNCESQQNIANLMTILHSLQINIVSGFIVCIFIYTPTDHCKHRIPHSCSKSGKYQKSANMHSRQSCRNTYQLAPCRNEPAKES